MAPKATLAAPTSQQKKPRASRGGREAIQPVRTPTALAMASLDEGALEGFETLEHRGKKAKRSAAKADLATSDARKLRRASEATVRPVARADRPVGRTDRADHARSIARARRR
eukprot:jgi/Pico_ML_1/56085/g1677.t1